MSTQRRRPITRNRESLACTECRRRKLKCDRNDPCNSCTKRGDEAACKYQHSGDSVENERKRRLQAEARLEHLEHLVHHLAESGTGSAFQSRGADGHPTTETDHDSKQQDVVPKDQQYIGATHWSAMLEDIEELRHAITPHAFDHAEFSFNSSDHNPTGIIFGSRTSLTLEQILSQYLPLRQEADRLVAAYFRADAVAAPFLHKSYFQKRYQEFWSSSDGASPLWTSLLFSICHVAANTLTISKNNTTQDNNYTIAAAHCLVIGQYFRPQPWAVESLLLYAQSKCLTRFDITPDLGILFGTLVRLATSMGYHRDPESYKMKPFAKEMRRRTWSMCMQLDILVSFHLGLPSNVQFPTWDTHSPRNIMDEDFDEDTEELPPARSDTQITGQLFYNAKHKIMAVFEKVLRHTLSTQPTTITDVDSLDTELRTTWANVPEILHPQLMTDSVVAPASVIVTCLCVNFLYQMSRCVLHRKYATQGREQSIRECHDAATTIVAFFLEAYPEFRPGGRLDTERWFSSGLTWHQFLLGTMALCMVVCVTKETGIKDVVDTPNTFALLRNAREVCQEQSNRSKNVTRILRAIDATISRLGRSINGHRPIPTPDAPVTQTDGFVVIDSLNTETDMDGTCAALSWGQDDWIWNEAMISSVSDPSWNYLEQYLDLPIDDV